MQRQPAEFKAAREGLLNAFPAKYVVGAGLVPARSAADGDHVVVRWRARATHRGGSRHASDEPQGRLPGNDLAHLRNGVIVEGWDSWNLGRLLWSLK